MSKLTRFANALIKASMNANKQQEINHYDSYQDPYNPPKFTSDYDPQNFPYHNSSDNDYEDFDFAYDFNNLDMDNSEFEIIESDVQTEKDFTTEDFEEDISSLYDLDFFQIAENALNEVVLNEEDPGVFYDSMDLFQQFDEIGFDFDYVTAEPQELQQESESLINELERIGNMYEKGLLTDEEFAVMKKKLIEGD